MDRKIKIASFALIGVALFLTAVNYLAVAGQRREAEAFLADSRKVVVGTTSYSDAQKILARYSSHLRYSDPCTPNHCQMTFLFQNSWLRFFHLAPSTDFGGSLIFDDGVLFARVTHLGQGRWYVDHITEGRTLVAPVDPSSPNFSVDLQRDENGQALKGMVMLTPQATDEQRREAYSFNLNCLSRLGGCKTAEELLPAIWKKN